MTDPSFAFSLERVREVRAYGTVDAVDYTGGTPTLTIAGKAGIDPAKVFNVR